MQGVYCGNQPMRISNATFEAEGDTLPFKLNWASGIKNTKQEMQCRVQIYGRGSAFTEYSTGEERDGPMHFHSALPGIHQVVELCNNLLVKRSRKLGALRNDLGIDKSSKMRLGPVAVMENEGMRYCRKLAYVLVKTLSRDPSTLRLCIFLICMSMCLLQVILEFIRDLNNLLEMSILESLLLEFCELRSRPN
jgi:hypothetical protein